MMFNRLSVLNVFSTYDTYFQLTMVLSGHNPIISQGSFIYILLMNLKDTLTRYAGIKIMPPNSTPTLFPLNRLHFFASWLTVWHSHSRVLEGHYLAKGGRRDIRGSQQLTAFLAVQLQMLISQSHYKSGGSQVFKASSPHQTHWSSQWQPHPLLRELNLSLAGPSSQFLSCSQGSSHSLQMLPVKTVKKSYKKLFISNVHVITAVVSGSLLDPV